MEVPAARVRVEREDRLVLLTIDRAEARNALDRETVDELRRALDQAAADPGVGCVVLTGAGEKVFVSGADVRELRDRTAKQGLEARLSRFFADLERHPQVTIAAINGFCLGGGLELALACDIRIAADSARFGFPETGIGILPGAGGTQRLPRLVGLGRAKHLVLTGEAIDAGAALGMGLVSAVVPLPDLLRAARELAAKVLSRGPLATRLAKAALNLSGEAPLAAGLQFEAIAQSVLYQSEDKREGTTAFLEKEEAALHRGLSVLKHRLRLGITKGGQLGRLLIQAAIDYDIVTAVLDPDETAPCHALCDEFVRGDPDDAGDLLAFGRRVDVLTLEYEHVSVEALERLAAEGVAVRPSPEVLRVVQDKGCQKEFYRANGIPTAEFVLVEGAKDVRARLDFLPAVQKTRRAGYDGKGVVKLHRPADLDRAFDQPSVLERWVEFDKEIAVIVARSAAGEVVAYPPVEMEFQPEHNLVEFLSAPAALPEDVAQRAIAIAIRLAHALGVVGLLAVEMFAGSDGELLVNEIAPRPHNSGHHTIEANVTSQYQQHLRAILDLPLGSTAARSPAVLVNLLGAPGHRGKARYEGLAEVLEMEDVHVHLYGKALTAPYRKMGHVTVLDPDLGRARAKAERIRETLRVVT